MSGGVDDDVDGGGVEAVVEPWKFPTRPGSLACFGPTIEASSSVSIVVTDKDPYDLDIRLVWDDDEQRLVPDDLGVTRRPNGIPVRAADLGRIRIGQLIESNLTAEILDSRGWEGIIEDQSDADPAVVDALICALAHALGGHDPTHTVAIARNADLITICLWRSPIRMNRELVASVQSNLERLSI